MAAVLRPEASRRTGLLDPPGPSAAARRDPERLVQRPPEWRVLLISREACRVMAEHGALRGLQPRGHTADRRDAIRRLLIGDQSAVRRGASHLLHAPPGGACKP